MAELIKNPRRLKPVVGFGANLPRKARKRGVNKSLRRDLNIAKARRAEARELRLQGRTLSRVKAAADTQSAIRAKADRDNRTKLWLEAKAEAETAIKKANAATRASEATAEAVHQSKTGLKAKAKAAAKAARAAKAAAVKAAKAAAKAARAAQALPFGFADDAFSAAKAAAKAAEEAAEAAAEAAKEAKDVILASTLLTIEEKAATRPNTRRQLNNQKLARELSLAKSRLEAATRVAIARPARPVCPKVVSGTGRK